LLSLQSQLIIIGSFGAYVVESPYPDSKITDLGDAFWWAIVTVATVRIGDVYHVMK
jgi:voltage-gated potassium channel